MNIIYFCQKKGNDIGSFPKKKNSSKMIIMGF